LIFQVPKAVNTNLIAEESAVTSAHMNPTSSPFSVMIPWHSLFVPPSPSIHIPKSNSELGERLVADGLPIPNGLLLGIEVRVEVGNVCPGGLVIGNELVSPDDGLALATGKGSLQLHLTEKSNQ